MRNGAQELRPHTRNILALLALIGGYLATRLYRIATNPPFIDETIHRWMAILAMAGNSAPALENGKWLAIQSYAIWMRLAGDTLSAMRWLAVVLGVAAVSVLFLEGCSYADEHRTARGALAALWYIVTPLALFYDRQALTDEFLVILLALILFASMRFSQKGSPVALATFCVLIVAAPLFKASGVLFVPVPLIVVLVVAGDDLRKRMTRMVIPYLAATALALIASRWLTSASPIVQRSSSIPSLTELAHRMTAHGMEVVRTLWVMVTPQPLLFLLIGIALAVTVCSGSSRRRIVAVTLVLLFLLAVITASSAYMYSRYVVPAVIPLCMLGAEVMLVGFDALRDRTSLRPTVIWVLVLALGLTWPVVSSARLLLDPGGAPLTRKDRIQYFTGWASGWGLQPTVQTLRDLSLQHGGAGIVVLRSPMQGATLWSLDAMRGDLGPKVSVQTFRLWQFPEVGLDLDEQLEDPRPVYVVFDSAYPNPNDRDVLYQLAKAFKVDEVNRFDRPGGNPGLVIWRVRSRASTTNAEQTTPPPSMEATREPGVVRP